MKSVADACASVFGDRLFADLQSMHQDGRKAHELTTHPAHRRCRQNSGYYYQFFKCPRSAYPVREKESMVLLRPECWMLADVFLMTPGWMGTCEPSLSLDDSLSKIYQNMPCCVVVRKKTFTVATRASHRSVYCERREHHILGQLIRRDHAVESC